MDVWSLKGKLKTRKELLNPKYEQYDSSFEIIDCYDREDIETLYKLIIEDLGKTFLGVDENLEGLKEIEDIIDKRFGMK